MARPRVRAFLMVAGLGAVLVLGACSSDPEEATTTERGKLSFGVPADDELRLGICGAYTDDAVKAVLGEDGFRKLAPQVIGTEGDPVTGEKCSWVREPGGGSSLALNIEGREFADEAAAEAELTELEANTVGAEPFDLADGAFSSQSDTTSLVQVRTGRFIVTLSTLSTGDDVEPVPADTLRIASSGALDALEAQA